MATTSKLKLIIVSQEKKLLEKDVDSVTAMTTTGEVTILPFHIPLFTKVTTSLLRYQFGQDEDEFVISDGFMTVSPKNEVTVMVDSAIETRSISLQQAEKAVEDAKATMLSSEDRHELIMAEASLRLALLEIRVAQRTKKTQY